jgi:hypothetical protein
MDLSRGDTRMIIDACIEHGLLRNQCAYVLATAWHETAHTMKPVREYGGEKYLKAKRYYPYVGMGYVQLTWKENYEKAGKRFGVDFVKHPKYLLKPEYAAPILVVGMQEGWFTGKKLADYMTLRKSDFRGARRIVNGLDKADLIANYAKQFDALLKAAGYGVEIPREGINPGTQHSQGIEPPKVAEKPREEIGPAEPAGIPATPGVVHVEKDGTIKPGPAAKPVERNPLWRLLFALLGLIWSKPKEK